jgi:hypothetical protein
MVAMLPDIEPNQVNFHRGHEVSRKTKDLIGIFQKLTLQTSHGLGNNRFKSTFSLQ